jgi:hypothetical protein
MTSPTAIAIHEGEATNDVRMLVAIAWVVGPTASFVGWFLQSLIAGSQRATINLPETQYGLMLLFAFITSIPLVIVSLIGAGAAIFSDKLRTQRLLNVIALVWSGMVFALYFGLFGAVGTFTKDGFPITALTMTTLVLIALVSIAVPVILFYVARRHIRTAERTLPPPPPDAFDI